MTDTDTDTNINTPAIDAPRFSSVTDVRRALSGCIEWFDDETFDRLAEFVWSNAGTWGNGQAVIGDDEMNVLIGRFVREALGQNPADYGL